MPLLPLLLAGTLLACPKEGVAVKKPKPSPTASPSAKARPSAKPPAKSSTASEARAREEACVDRWLSQRKLDPYGSPEGTVYAGGTPLFDEGTGQQIDRLDYIYRQHPEARAACAPRPGGR